MQAERLATPTKTVTQQNFSLSSEIHQKIRSRNSLLRNYRRNGNDLLKQEINQLIHLSFIDEKRNNRFAQTLDEINRDDNMHSKLWKITKNLKKKSSGIPALNTTYGKAITDVQKAEVLSEEIEKGHNLTHFPERNRKVDKDVKRKIRKIDRATADVPNSSFITVREIKQHIKSLKNKKAPGHDGIRNILLKRLPNKANILITHIFNACMRLSYFPVKWKRANVLTFKKPGKDPKNPNNYRPISLLPTLGKLFEKCIMKSINFFVQENDVLNDEQFGFRSGHCCSH